jgi:hypothetical protein
VQLVEDEVEIKLRILASSASLPTTGDEGDRSLKYLDGFFGPFGTSRIDLEARVGGAGREDRGARNHAFRPLRPIPKTVVGLGLDEPVVRHKLRILASSASLPTTGDEGDRSLKTWRLA